MPRCLQDVSSQVTDAGTAGGVLAAGRRAAVLARRGFAAVPPTAEDMRQHT